MLFDFLCQWLLRDEGSLQEERKKKKKRSLFHPSWKSQTDAAVTNRSLFFFYQQLCRWCGSTLRMCVVYMSGNEKHTVAAAYIFSLAYARYFGRVSGFACVCLKKCSFTVTFLCASVRGNISPRVCVCVCHLSPCLTVCFPVTVSLFSTCAVWYFLVSRRARVRVRTVFAWGALDSILVSSNQQTVERDAAQGWGGRKGDAHKHILRSHTAKHSRKKSHPRQPPLTPLPFFPPFKDVHLLKMWLRTKIQIVFLLVSIKH